MITLTSKAKEVIQQKLKQYSFPRSSAIRFAVSGGGCSGFSYKTTLEKPSTFEMAPESERFVVDGIRVLIDKKSALFLSGMEVDYEQDDFNGNFVYNNPNSKGSCGCGISFTPY